MYLIIKTLDRINVDYNCIISCTGDFPTAITEELLNLGNDIIVISLYSNTIKVPYLTELNGIESWEWKEYPFPLVKIVSNLSLN